MRLDRLVEPFLFWLYRREPVRVGQDYTTCYGVYVCGRRVAVRRFKKGQS